MASNKAKAKTALAKKRSAAAKRGWVTRRKKAALIAEITKKTELIYNAKKGVKKKPARKKPTKSVTRTKKKTVEELEKIIKRKDAEIAALKVTKDWVHAMPVEFLKADGSIALESTMLRHMGKLTDKILGALRKALKKGVFDKVANELAGIWDVPLREIYTLWYSP